VSAREVDEYLGAVEEPKRGTLETLRRTILEIVPEADQVISYRVPAFRVRGKTVAGFAAFNYHLSYLPFSGSVLEQLADELDNYTVTKSSLHFPVDRCDQNETMNSARDAESRISSHVRQTFNNRTIVLICRTLRRAAHRRRTPPAGLEPATHGLESRGYPLCLRAICG
jgi:uncharacterized protein YdhG (YjbR/CyaY superfamily)